MALLCRETLCMLCPRCIGTLSAALRCNTLMSVMVSRSTKATSLVARYRGWCGWCGVVPVYRVGGT